MTEFEIYTKTVEISGKEYKLRPLSGRFLPQLWALLSTADEEQNDEALKELIGDEKNMERVFTVCFETFKKSYPKADPEALEDFVARNLWEIFGVVAEINTPDSAPGE